MSARDFAAAVFAIDQGDARKDRIDVKSASRWLSLLLEADSERFIRWFLQEKLELIEFYLFNSIEVRVREHPGRV